MARPRGLAGQAIIEFALMSTILFTLVFGFVEVGYATFRKSMLDYQITQVGDALPAGWDGRDARALVKGLITGPTKLKASEVTVSSATATVVDDRGLATSDSVATALGSSSAYRQNRYLKVTARVTYKYGTLTGFIDSGVYTRDFTRTLSLERRYEIS